MITNQKETQLQNNIVFLFIGIFICLIIGFHRTYTIYFPQFKGFHWEQHFHGAMLLIWMLLLLIQPLLIRFKKNNLHRNIGKLGYVFAPLVCYSIFAVSRMSYFRDISSRPSEMLFGKLALDIPPLVLFGLFFLLSMINRKNSFVHMRYMIATGLLMLGPGLGRALIIFGEIPFPIAISISHYIDILVIILFLLYDIRKGNSYKPFLVILLMFFFLQLCWQYQDAGWWQGIAKGFVRLAF